MITAVSLLAAAFGRGEPACERARLAGVDALISRPSDGSGHVVVYANAATSLGVEQPLVRQFLAVLARAGFVAVAPELPSIRDGEVTLRTVEALVTVARAAGPRIALVGVSTGAGLSILAAADPRLAPRVVGVTAIAPFASLKNVLRLATTGFYDDRPYAAEPFVARTAVRSFSACAPGDPAVSALLANRDPRRFDALYAELLPTTRALVRELSPVTHIAEVLAPVELASSPADRFFPVGESQLLVRAGRDVSLTVTDALEHVRPRPRAGLVLLAALLARTLRQLSAGDSLAPQPSFVP
jgi:dienelactone hydrolase